MIAAKFSTARHVEINIEIAAAIGAHEFAYQLSPARGAVWIADAQCLQAARQARDVSGES